MFILLYIYTLVLQIRSQKVFGDQKPSPNTVSEGVWSCKDIYTYYIDGLYLE